MSVKRAARESVPESAPARTEKTWLELKELEERVRIINEILGAIKISVDHKKIDSAVKSAGYETYMSIDEGELIDLKWYLKYWLPDEIKRSVVKAVLGEHYVDPMVVDYEAVGFAGWEGDECPHYAFVKLADGRYALIYSCNDEVEYALPEQ
jgi:hypothetical protein